MINDMGDFNMNDRMFQQDRATLLVCGVASNIVRFNIAVLVFVGLCEVTCLGR